MKPIARFTLLVLSLVMSGTAAALAPLQINFQGVLKDASGVPIASATKGVRIRIYDDPVSGSLLWAESLSVTTDVAGRFTAILGDDSPVSGTIFSDTGRYVGIKIEGDPELVPRIRLASSPYSLRTNSIHGAYGGTLYSTPGQPAELYLDNGSGLGTVELRGSNYGLGGSAYFWENDNQAEMFIEPDVDGTGGFLGVLSDAASGFAGMYVDGSTQASGSPSLTLVGNTGTSIYVDTRYTGDDAVALPNGAIDAAEILDEPGIASNYSTAVTLNTGGMVDVVTVSITIPAAGYVVVDGKCYAQVYNTTGYNGGYFQIDRTAGGSYTDPYRTSVGYSAWPNLQGTIYSVYTTRSYYFATPGSYTFRLEGMAWNAGGGAAVEADNGIIRATYFPTSYGSVNAVVSSSEAGDFETAEPVETRGTAQAGATAEPAYRVDLRELELRAVRAQEEAQRALAELLRARLERQGTRRTRDSASK